MTSNKKINRPKFSGILTPKYKEEMFNYLLSNLDLKLDENQILLLRKAYNVAFKAHEDQVRKVSKEPYIIHPVEVALIVANEMGLDFIAVLAALLHDVLEDSDIFAREYIKKEFGAPVELTVWGVTKMTQAGGKARAKTENSKIDEKLKTFEKLILSVSKEYRVILIKIADRLHNMRTMEGMPEEKQKDKSAENLYVYAKFAEAVGMYDIKVEMEDLSFKYLHHDDYQNIYNEIAKRQPFYESFLEDLKIDIYRILSQETNYNFTIKKIRNSYYSVWEKLKKNEDLTIDQIYNFESLRIVVDLQDRNLSDVVFNIFVKITNHYPMLANSLRDWIRNPKPNGFRALVFDIVYHHPKTIGHIPQIAEIQILSKEDDIIAHKGANFERLKKSILPRSDDESITEFISRVLKQLNTEYIYIFTPAGEIHKLPKGATVIDFAFKIHTDIGLHCIGAKIQGMGAKAPTYKLTSGDVVEVLYSMNKKPDIEWLKKVVTEKARRELTNYFKKNKLLSGDHGDNQKSHFEFSSNLPLVIDGSFDFKIADCCNPIPGDRAYAIQDEKGNIVIHREDCPDLPFLAKVSRSGIARVEWVIKEVAYDISIKAMDRIGLLKDILELISSSLEMNLTNINMNIDRKEKLVSGMLTIMAHQDSINDKIEPECIAETNEEKISCANEQLHNIVENLKNIEGIIEVQVKIHHND